MAYAKIADQTYNIAREDGTSKTVTIELYKEGATAGSASLGVVGEIVYEQGIDGDKINEPILPASIEITLKEGTSTLIQELRSIAYHQYKLKVIEDGSTLIEGPVVEDLSGYNLFQADQVTIFGIDGVQDLKNADGTTTSGEVISTFFERLQTATDQDLPVDFQTIWQHDGYTLSDPMPDYVRIQDPQYLSLSGGGGSLYHQIRGLLKHFGWQLIQKDGRWVISEAYARINSPSAVRRYSGDGAGNLTAGTTNLLKSLDGGGETKAYPEGKRNPSIGEFVHQWALSDVGENGRYIWNTWNNELNDGTGWDTQNVSFASGGAVLGSDGISSLKQNGLTPEEGGFINPFGLAVEGDTFSVDPSTHGDIQVNVAPADDPEFRLRILKVKFISLIDGKTYYHSFVNGGWLESDTGLEVDVTTEDYDATGMYEWSMGDFGKVLDTDPVPRGEVGYFEIEGRFDIITVSQATAADIYQVRFENLIGRTIKGSSPTVYKKFSAKAGDFGSDEVTTVNLGDFSKYGQVSFTYIPPGGGAAVNTTAWVDNGGNGALGELGARRMGKMMTGTRDKFRLVTRDLKGIDLLHVVDFTDDNGNTHRCLPVFQRKEIVSGFVELVLVEASEQAITESEVYSLAGAEDSTPSTGAVVGGGSPSGEGLTESKGNSLYLEEAKNGADIPDKPTFRDNIGLGATDTPTFGQTILNNPASQDTHALRGGQVLNTDDPITGGGKLRNGLHIGLSYNATNIKTTAGALDTIQDIHTDANMILKTLMLKQGLTIDDILGYIKSEDLTGFDWLSAGMGIQKNSNGEWDAVFDNLSIRKRAKFRELLFEEIIAFAKFLMNESNKVDEVEQIGYADWSWADDTIQPFAAGATNPDGIPYTFANQYRCYIDADTRVQLAAGDLVQRQAFSGNEIGVTQAVVIGVEQGAADINDNSIRRYFDVAIYNGDAPVPGQTYVRLGNETDVTRMGGIYLAGSGQYAPHEILYDGVDRFDLFGDPSTIKDFRGNVEGRSFPGIPELDGTQGREFATVSIDGYYKGRIYVTGGNAATKDYVDGKAGGSKTIRADSAPTTRPGGSSLEAGDIWIDTDNNDRIYTYSGSAWEASETTISGSRISITMDQVAPGSTYGRILQTELSAGHILIKGPDGQTVIDEGTLSTDAIFASDATISGTLTVTGANVKMGHQVYNSATLGQQDGILTGNGTMLVSDQGIDFDGRASTGKEIEWHDTDNANDLTSNSNLIGEVSARVAGSENQLSIRSQSSLRDSKIILTATNVDVQADIQFNNKRLNGLGITRWNTDWRTYSGSGTDSLDSVSDGILMVNPTGGEVTFTDINVTGGNEEGMIVFVVNTGSYSIFFNNAGNIRTQAVSTVRTYEGSMTAFIYNGNHWILWADAGA